MAKVVAFSDEAVSYISEIERSITNGEDQEAVLDVFGWGLQLSDYGIHIKEYGDTTAIVDTVDTYMLGSSFKRSFGYIHSVLPGSKISWIAGGGPIGNLEDIDEEEEFLPLEVYQGHVSGKQEADSEDVAEESFPQEYGASDGLLKSKDLLAKLREFFSHTIGTECNDEEGEYDLYQGVFIEFVGGPSRAGTRTKKKPKKKKKKKTNNKRSHKQTSDRKDQKKGRKGRKGRKVGKVGKGKKKGGKR